MATLKQCRTCGEKKETTPIYFSISRINGKAYWSRECLACKRKKSRSKFKRPGVTKARHKTEYGQKLQAYCRDKKCIYPGCTESDFYRLDFHHAFSKPMDKLPRTDERGNNVDWNSYFYGVVLCRKHHEEVKVNDGLYDFCQYYLRHNHAKFSYVLKNLSHEETDIMQAYFIMTKQ